MIFPSLEIIDKDSTLYFHNNGFERINRYQYIRNIYYPDEKTAYLVLSQNFTNTTKASQYIQDQGYTTLIFFIDDVFRDHIGYTNDRVELFAIKDIIEKTKITDYKIYHCEMLNDQFSSPVDVNIEYFDLFLAHWIKEHPYHGTQHLNFENKISFFNNRDDFSRQYMAAMLIEQDYVHTTLNQKHNYKMIKTQQLFPINGFSKEFQQILRPNLQLLDRVHPKYIDDNNHDFTMLQDFDEQHDDVVIKWIENSFINLVGETTFYYPYPYISEKTLKPMLAHRPFIILGAPGILKALHNFGFKTFDKWVDEDYDNELDPYKRFEMVYKLTQDVLRKGTDELTDMLNDMEDVLIHNRKLVNRLPHLIWESIL